MLILTTAREFTIYWSSGLPSKEVTPENWSCKTHSRKGAFFETNPKGGSWKEKTEWAHNMYVVAVCFDISHERKTPENYQNLEILQNYSEKRQNL